MSDLTSVQLSKKLGLEGSPGCERISRHALNRITDLERQLKEEREVNDRSVKENQRLTTDRQNAISLMSPSWKHAASAEPNIMTRYVTMAENQFKKKSEAIERLAAIATKHATRADERYELLEKQKSDIEKMLDQLFHHENVDAWLVCKMNDMLGDVNHQLGMSQIEAVIDSNDD